MGLLVIPALVVVLAGYVLGRIPVLNELLHISLWLVVPIGATLIGAGLAWLAFQAARMLEIPTQGHHTRVGLMVACVISYALTDYGVYHSLSVAFQETETSEVKSIPVDQLMSFGEFMEKVRLASSTVMMKPGIKFTLGAGATTSTYVIDMLGCMGGAFAMLYLLASTRPFCERCKKYKNPSGSLSITVRDEDEIRDAHALIGGAVTAGYEALVKQLQKIAREGVSSGQYRIDAAELVCPTCQEVSILGTVHKRAGEDWNELYAKRFTCVSEPGLGPRLNGSAKAAVPAPEA